MTSLRVTVHSVNLRKHCQPRRFSRVTKRTVIFNEVIVYYIIPNNCFYILFTLYFSLKAIKNKHFLFLHGSCYLCSQIKRHVAHVRVTVSFIFLWRHIRQYSKEITWYMIIIHIVKFPRLCLIKNCRCLALKFH